jgi:IS30 family transposase
MASARRSRASVRPVKWTPELEERVKSIIEGEQWSPEQISGRLQSEGIYISHERIYQYVHQSKKQGLNLYKHLRHKGKKYNYKRGNKAGRGVIPGRIDITERPSVVEDKSRLGDWEADLVIGKNHKGALLTLVDRTSKFTLIKNVFNKTAKNVLDGIKVCFKNIPDCAAKTMTFDNGKEFSCHLDVAKHLEIDCYFAAPYSSWQRGLNEHTNGLIRQYLPKGSDFDTIKIGEIENIQSKLNNRPRKILDYKTPREVFNQMTVCNESVALGT